MTTSIMSIHSQVVSEAVREEGHTRSSLKDVFLITLKDTQVQESFNGNLVSSKVNIIPYHTLLEHVDADLLHLQDDVVDCSTFRGELAIYWKGSCLTSSQHYARSAWEAYNIRSITIILRTCIQQEI